MREHPSAGAARPLPKGAEGSLTLSLSLSYSPTLSLLVLIRRTELPIRSHSPSTAALATPPRFAHAIASHLPHALPCRDNDND